ncbi:MAG: undecaprenyl-diphosphate phosphatase [Candidatus Kerfeldbacteria bacterium]|nr:undecaprenyl-diphosphate phosphatase [Candidatus Kerfeldbacteria bacterium]
MGLLQSLILGLVEGVTEFLPISSTGHLILTTRLLGLDSTEFVKSFEIIIQLGAILAVVVLYWRTLFVNWAIMKRLAVAFLPTAVIGLALYRLVKQYLLGSNAVVLWAMLLGGLALIIFELVHQEPEARPDELARLPYGTALVIGLCQSLAIVPGVSRAAATIVGGLSLGLSRRAAVEFSFLLAVPTMLAATGLDLFKNASSFSSSQFGVLSAGFIVSFVVALMSIKFLLGFIKQHTFIPFGLYRILAAVSFWLVIF